MDSDSEFLKSIIKNIAGLVESILPENYGFTLLTYPFNSNEESEVFYISNSDRNDVAKVMKEWIEQNENTEE